MTLLEDVDAYLNNPSTDLYRYDIKDVTDATQSKIKEAHIYLDRLRWGVLYGTVLYRRMPDQRPNVAHVPDFEYVMVAEYEFDEGADGGDAEVSAWAVVPKLVSTTEWVKP